jgi:hypothetical protein
MRNAFAVVSLLSFVLLAGSEPRAQAPVAVIHSPEPQAFDQLGYSVAVHGRTLITAKRLYDGPELNSGAILVYQRTGDGWTLQEQVEVEQPLLNDFLGTSTALWRDRMVLGTAHTDGIYEYSGSAYILERIAGQWQQTELLEPPNSQTGLRFGETAEVERDLVVIGAPGEHVPTFKAGRVYVYRDGDEGWEHTQILEVDGPVDSRLFGIAMDLDNDRLVVGAPWDSEIDTTAGAAFVYTHDGRGQFVDQVKLLAPDGAKNDEFGQAVGISGRWIAVGAHADDDHGNSSGSVHVFEFSGGAWVHRWKLISPEVTADDYFGQRLQLDGDLLAVFAFNPSLALGSHAGSVTVYKLSADEPQLLGVVKPDPVLGDIELGSALALDGNVLVCGAYLDDQVGEDAGSTFVYELHTSGDR